jgi:predicted RNase H-like nuclease (RuvC/YqgF family)
MQKESETMTYEKCESKVNNLLASMEQMTSTTEKLRVLTKIVEEQAREIEELSARLEGIGYNEPIQDESRD